MQPNRLSDVSDLYMGGAAHAAEFPYEAGQPRWFNQAFHFLERRCRLVIAFWAMAYMVGLLVGPSFLKMSDDSWKAPKGTRSYPAQQMFDARFATQSKVLPVMLFVTSHSDVRTEEMALFNKKLRSDVMLYNDSNGNLLGYMSYYEMDKTLLDGAKAEFVSSDYKAAFFDITVRGDSVSSDRYDFVKHLRKTLKAINPNATRYTMGLTGVDAMAYDMADDTERNVMRIDMFTMPFAMGLLGFMIKSWRLLIISGFNLGVSILFSFAVMAMAVHLGAPKPESATSQLMEVMVLAVSIDWSLFLHRRFRDEVKRGAPVRQAAYVSLLHSGHVVVMSGATLFIVFIGFTLLPAAVVQMDGACCAVGVLVAMAVALTSNVSFWLAFPNFCGDFDPRCCKATTIKDLERELAQMQQAVVAPLIADETTHVMYSGPRFRFTRWVTRYPNNIVAIVIVYLLVVPLGVAMKDMVVNQNILSSMPRASESATTFKKAFDYFPGGTFSPFYVLVAAPTDAMHAVRSASFFKATADVAKAVLDASLKHDKRFTSMSVSSPALLKGVEVPLLEAIALLETAHSHACNVKHVSKLDWVACSAAKEFQLEWDQSVNDRESAMLITIIVPFFPFAQESSDYIDVLYATLDAKQIEHAGVVDLYLCGFEVGFNALMHKVFKLFPALIGGTFAIVFVVLGFLLRSAFVPFRLTLTLVAPLAAVFGAGTLVYQDGWLEWTNLVAFQKMDGFFWYVPILLLSMIIGLAIDWDVLLISRIQEHRSKGYEIRAAICKAVCETGGTISAAGIIMCLAFGGLLLSDQSTTNACGFILTVALLLDTFVVNTVLVPAILSMGDKIAWYPAEMPHDNLKGLDCGEFPVDSSD